MRIALTDLETTGLDSDQHEIIEIGLIVFDSETFTIEKTFETKVKPLHPETGHPKAFEVNGYNALEWEDAPSLEEAMLLYVVAAENASFCAHNMIFDYSFLSAASKKTNIPLPFGKHKIDLLTLAWTKLHNQTSKFNLKHLCGYLNIDPEPDMHRALNGAMSGYHVFRRIMQ